MSHSGKRTMRRTMRRAPAAKNLRKTSSNSKSKKSSGNSNNSDQGYETSFSSPEGSPTIKKYLTLDNLSMLDETNTDNETNNITDIKLKVKTEDKYYCELTYKKDTVTSISFSLQFYENIDDILEELKNSDADPGFTDKQFDFIEKEFNKKKKLPNSVKYASKTWRAKTLKSGLRRKVITSYSRTSLLNKIKNTISLDFEYLINPKIFNKVELISSPEESGSGSIVYKLSTNSKEKYNFILKITLIGSNIKENNDALIEYEHYKNMTLLIKKNITPYVFRTKEKLGPFKGAQLKPTIKKEISTQFNFDIDKKKEEISSQFNFDIDKKKKKMHEELFNSTYFFAMINETATEGETIPFMSFLKRYYKNKNFKEIIYNLLFQLLYTLECFNRMSMKHNDLHLSNIMVILKKKNLTNSKPPDKFYRKFIYTDKKGKEIPLYLPNIGIEIRIFDFDRSCKYKKTKLSQKIYSKFVEKDTHQNCTENKYGDTYRLLYLLHKYFTDIYSTTKNIIRSNIDELIKFITSCFNNEKLLIYGLNKKNKFLNLTQDNMRYGILRSKPYRGEMLKTDQILLKIIDEIKLETKDNNIRVLETYEIGKIIKM